MRSPGNRCSISLAPVAIGFDLTVLHQISRPVTRTSANPARSTGVAVFLGGWTVDQLWLFSVAPLVGALPGAGISRFISDSRCLARSRGVRRRSGGCHHDRQVGTHPTETTVRVEDPRTHPYPADGRDSGQERRCAG